MCVSNIELRDFFAAQAMQGLAKFLLERPESYYARPANEKEIAEQAYAMADAMMEERAK